MNVHFINSTHNIGTEERRAPAVIAKPVIVGDGTWIGADCIIMPGVNIGKGCIIGAGSLLLNDTEENSVYVGRPARKIRDLEKDINFRENTSEYLSDNI